MSEPIIFVLLSLMPVGILSLILEVWHRSKNQTRRLPVQVRLLRPPGESCQQKINEIRERLEDIVCWLLGFPAALLAGYLYQNGTKLPESASLFVWLVVLGVAAIFFGALIFKFVGERKKLEAYRLGLYGERIVGEQLNQLMYEGCRVFHDFPLADNWNVDHVVVAPSGIYAVETKTKRKGASSSSQSGHEVVYDGHSLEFPFYTDTEALQQARDQAEALAKFFKETLQESLFVKPVLTFPGWYVVNRGQGDVLVLNPKMIEPAILAPAILVLKPDRIAKIARALDQKCRDVEF